MATHFGSTLLLPELSDLGPAVRVPELRDVAITPRVRRLVDRPEVQRLRRVRQLGPTHLVYPGATHSRFEHSLGTYGYVQRFCVSLLRAPAFRDGVGERDLLAVLLCGLLHDIGHYPFAHSLEALHRRGHDTPRHEAIGAAIVTGSLADVIWREFRVEPARVARLMTQKHAAQPTRLDRILASMISSSIDADKMDYLQRDSAHLGVPYGRSFDAGRLLAALTLSEGEDQVAIDAKGKVPAEMFVFSRYMMFSEAYWHHTVRAASAMIEAALYDYMGATQPAPAALEALLLGSRDDRLLEVLLERSNEGSVARRLLAGMTHDRRRLHKRVMTFSRVFTDPDKQRAYERLYALDGPGLDALTDRLRATLARILGQPVLAGEVLVDTPPRDKDHPETVDVRYRDVRGRASYPLHELSRVVAGVHTDFVKVVKKIRVFVAPHLADRAREPAAVAQIMEAILA